MGTLEQALEELRSDMKELASKVKSTTDFIKKQEYNDNEDKGEMIANSILSYRHLEDAAMRIGKVMQAKNGGVSIYDNK